MQYHKHRFYLGVGLTPGMMIDAPDSLTHHIGRVLRLEQGAQIRLFDGHGHEHLAEITQISRKRVSLIIGDPLIEEPLPILSLDLIQAVTRGERMDYTVQKATELGIERIVLIETERCQIRYRGPRLEKKMAHWRQIIISACEQSGRCRVPELLAPISLSDYLSQSSETLRLLCCPEASESLSTLVVKPSAVEFLIGPEGGLTDEEIEQASDAGMTRVLMGPRILRTETAGPAALVACQLLWGDM